MRRAIAVALSLAALTSAAEPTQRTPDLAMAAMVGVPHRSTFFFVDGPYRAAAGANVMDGAMYVERWQPLQPSRRYPIVPFHGSGMTGTNWMATPDGRPGWAQYFLSQGYTVCIVDRPARDRSLWALDDGGAFGRFDVAKAERTFTASERFKDWPQARLHTQ